MSDSGAPLTEEQISAYEARLGRPLPQDYRNFLLQHNGGYPDPSDFEMQSPFKSDGDFGTVDWFLGIDVSEPTLGLEYVLQTFADRIPPRLFPIARDPGGNLICLSSGGEDLGTVYFWDHERESEEGAPATEANLYRIAGGLEEFLNMLQ